MPPRLPVPRGPITEMLRAQLQQRPRRIFDGATLEDDLLDPLGSEDLQLALHLCYGLHYDGFNGVDDGWEWEPSLLALRARMEQRFLLGLTGHVGSPAGEDADLDVPSVVQQVRQLLSAEGPSLSACLSAQGGMDELREFVIHRSIYQRKEADPHTWAIPRLRGRAKSALVTLQSDEYGGGRAGATHAELFAETMAVLDLDPTPGRYIDWVPASTLATDNLVSYFGLHRRWRGALVGHLAAFEMTSVVPMGRYAATLRKILGTDAGAAFYDVHVEADVRHAQIAVDDLIDGLGATDPRALQDVSFGVAALMAVESRFSAHLLASWARGASSLLLPQSSRVLVPA
jgi:Iron-containing redox enzyme